MSDSELTDDEVAMLNWFREVQSSDLIDDETVNSLIAKSMLFVSNNKVFITATGLQWLDDHSRFFK